MTVLRLDDYRRSAAGTGRATAHPGRRHPRRRVAHQCPTCGECWSLGVVHHPSGIVLVCRHCGALQAVGPPPGDPSTVVRLIRALDPPV